MSCFGSFHLVHLPPLHVPATWPDKTIFDYNIKRIWPSHGGLVGLFVNFSTNNLGGRKIESRRQLCEREKREEGENYANLETKRKNEKGTPVNDHWCASALKIENWGLDLKLERVQETRFEGCELWIERPLWRMKQETWSIQESELQQEIRAVEAHLHWMFPKQLVMRRDGEKK